MSAEQLIPTIDLTEYRLVYYEIKTNKMFLARRLDGSSFKFYDPITGLKSDIGISRMRREFRGDDSNKKLRSVNFRKSKNIYHYE